MGKKLFEACGELREETADSVLFYDGLAPIRFFKNEVRVTHLGGTLVILSMPEYLARRRGLL